MVKRKQLEIHTVVVDGDSSSFKAALSRSILGVTWVQFKRRKEAFYKHRLHNLAVAQSIFNWLYEYLLSNVENLGTLKLKTDLKPIWDENGKIQGMSDVRVSIYMKIGELDLKELRVFEEFENVKVDLFYSSTDFASQRLRSELPSIIDSIGQGKIDCKKHDYATVEGEELGKAYGVKGTPTLVINAEEKLENPDEKQVRQAIEKAFAPMVKPVGKPRFTFDPEARSNTESLVQILAVKT